MFRTFSRGRARENNNNNKTHLLSSLASSCSVLKVFGCDSPSAARLASSAALRCASSEASEAASRVSVVTTLSRRRRQSLQVRYKICKLLRTMSLCMLAQGTIKLGVPWLNCAVEGNSQFQLPIPLHIAMDGFDLIRRT
eukprot:1175405-Prorocentrum_minimum.AAC.2